MKLLVALLLAACSSAEAKDPTGIVATLPCNTAGMDPWDHELFPSCPTMPYVFGLLHCPRGVCPKPCRIDAEAAAPEKATARQTIAYDASGRWLSSSGGDSQHHLVDWSCTYKTSRMDVCKQTYKGKTVKTVTLARDAKGRIASLEEDSDFVGKRSIPITYDAGGRVTSVVWSDKPLMREEYAYDARGRLAKATYQEGKRRTENVPAYNGAGSVIEEPGNRTTYEYDARGRLAKLTSKTDAGFNTDTLTYDDQDRVIRHDNRTSSGSHAVSYRYTYVCN